MMHTYEHYITLIEQKDTKKDLQNLCRAHTVPRGPYMKEEVQKGGS